MGTMGSATGNKISMEKEKGFRRVWHHITKVFRSDHEKAASTKGLTPPPVEKARPSTPAPKNSEPQHPEAKPGTEGVKEEPRIGNGSHGQDHFEEQGGDKNGQSENIDQPGASDGEKLAHRHVPKRDLWSEAWKSSRLEGVKNLLESPWKDPHSNAPDKPSNPPKKAKNTKETKILQVAEASPAHEDASGHGNSKKFERPEQLVEEVVVRTKTRMVTYEERWGSESKSTIAGTARKVVLSALVVKDLVGAGLAFDPTGYGACAWAVVSFGLKVKTNIVLFSCFIFSFFGGNASGIKLTTGIVSGQLIENLKVRMEKAFEATGYLTETLARYAKIQIFCRDVAAMTDIEGLENSIVEVYIAILQYSAEVKKANNGSDLSKTD